MHAIVALLWDLFCICSIIGIYPRFIEPKRLKVTHLKHRISLLEGKRFLHFSDLHFHRKSSHRFLKKLEKKINALQPDFILFTGDFICQSRLLPEQQEPLFTFLHSLKAPLGKFAVLGNHDYAAYISKNKEGHYDVKSNAPTHFLIQAVKAFFSKKEGAPKTTIAAKETPPHEELIAIIKKSGFTLLHNESLPLNRVTLVGLGDYWAGKADPKGAFKGVDPSKPVIVMSHNPDMARTLSSYRSDLILAGHTHGGQVNLPWIGNFFLGLENKRYKRGLFSLSPCSSLYVTRGVGDPSSFRIFSPPELVLWS